ncbi:hypothetical protein RCO48_14190 [Peribacillus frigoritolerans]|nr:hypothetical protein [Peribacillus frigoritolerans]
MQLFFKHFKKANDFYTQQKLSGSSTRQLPDSQSFRMMKLYLYCGVFTGEYKLGELFLDDVKFTSKRGFHA